MHGRLLTLVCSVTVAAAACGSSGSSSDGAGSGGKCSADVEAGQVCNAIANNATAITPTCMMGTMPTGTGGTIVDGTYQLTSQTYYNLSTCPTTPFSETLTISGGCLQAASSDFGATTSSMVVTQMNEITVTLTCSHFDSDAAVPSPDAPLQSFTATSTTFSRFTRNLAAGNSNPDRIEVFTKQ